MNRTVGTIATIASAILCGCPATFFCVGGLLLAFGVPVETVIGGQYSVQSFPAWLGYVALFFSLLLFAVPVVLAILTLRRRHRTPAPQAYASMPAPAVPQPEPTPAPMPMPRTPPSPVADPASQQVYGALMALNRESAPFRIVDGHAEGVDLIAEWKIVDARWYEIFAKANLTKIFRIFMKLDPAKREVRAMDQEYTLTWSAGIPQISVEKEFFKGQKTSVSFGTGYAFTEDLAPGQVYKYRFNTNEMKKPIQEAIKACGWKFKGVALGKL